MKPRFNHEDEGEESLEINISPLIDIVFMLLIFFIVTAVFSQDPGIEVNRPSAVTAETSERETLLFALSEAGKVHHDGQIIEIEQISAIVSRQPQRPVVIRADLRSLTEQLVAAVDAARLAGAVNVSVAAEKND